MVANARTDVLGKLTVLVGPVASANSIEALLMVGTGAVDSYVDIGHPENFSDWSEVGSLILDGLDVVVTVTCQPEYDWYKTCPLRVNNLVERWGGSNGDNEGN